MPIKETVYPSPIQTFEGKPRVVTRIDVHNWPIDIVKPLETEVILVEDQRLEPASRDGFVRGAPTRMVVEFPSKGRLIKKDVGVLHALKWDTFGGRPRAFRFEPKVSVLIGKEKLPKGKPLFLKPFKTVPTFIFNERGNLEVRGYFVQEQHV